jgi:hypothetical protein
MNLKKQGLLNEILYPELAAQRREPYQDSRERVDPDRFQGGREGGKRVRSIAKEQDERPRRVQSDAAQSFSAFESDLRQSQSQPGRSDVQRPDGPRKWTSSASSSKSTATPDKRADVNAEEDLDRY